MDLRDVFSRLDAFMRQRREPKSGEVRLAAALVDGLQDLTSEQRALMIRNSPRLHTVTVAKNLLDRAQRLAGEDPNLSLEWLDAFEVLAEVPAFDASPFDQSAIADLSALALIRRAHTFLKLGDLPSADLTLRICDDLEIVSIEVLGELFEARAWMHSVRQKVELALAELEEARQLYRSIGDDHLVGRAHGAKGYALGESRRYSEAVVELLEACRLIDPLKEPRVALAACFNLARYMRDAGRPIEAMEAMRLSKPFFESVAGRTDRAHWVWLEAALLASVGHLDAAVERYRDTLAEFADLGLAIEASEAAIEAVEAFAAKGRSLELLPLLALATRICRAQGFRIDELAAWVALREAVARDAVSLAVVAAAKAAVAQL